MKKNELRIGNLFWESYGGYKIVTGIKEHKAGLVDVYGKGINPSANAA